MRRAGWYERLVLPRLTDCACGIRAVREQRLKLVPLARGRVLEVGIGTGLNLPHYDPGRVDSIVGLDPALEMHPLAARRARRTGLPVELVGLSAERIPCPDASFDSVLVTYSLCSIADPLAALGEMRRVLKPGGRLIYCEHGLAPDAGVRRWQRRLTPLWSKLAGGCHLDRDVAALLARAGLVSPDMEASYLPGPRILTYSCRGTAFAA